MKKCSTILLLLFVSYCSYAQNWNCFVPGSKQYFINGNGYLKGIRIDSVRTVGSNTVYFPFHTVRDTGGTAWPHTDNNGGSWVGKKVIADSAGVFFFDNFFKDTVIIRTMADSGESWIFYNDNNDTTHLYYLATVIAKDTMSVLGVIDSIKRIQIQAYRDTGAVAYKVNGFEIILSKHNGLVQSFELYTFPYHKPYNNDTTIDIYMGIYGRYGLQASSMLFKQVKYIYPDNKDMQHYSIGDYFHYDCWYTDAFSSYSFKTYNAIETKTVIDKKIISSYETDYSFHRWYYTICFSCPPPYRTIDSGANDYTVAVYANMISDTTKMPEESGTDIVYWYKPEDTSFCYISPYYRWDSYGNYEGEGCGYGRSYKAGFGVIDTSICYDATGPQSYGKWMASAIKVGNYCHLSVPEMHNAGAYSISIYPNPSSSAINITANTPIQNIVVSNTIGQVVYMQTYNNSQVLKIDVSNWVTGVYFVKVNEVYSTKFAKQ